MKGAPGTEDGVVEGVWRAGVDAVGAELLGAALVETELGEDADAGLVATTNGTATTVVTRRPAATSVAALPRIRRLTSRQPLHRVHQSDQVGPCCQACLDPARRRSGGGGFGTERGGHRMPGDASRYPEGGAIM